MDDSSLEMRPPELVRIKQHQHGSTLHSPKGAWFAVLSRENNKVHIGNGYERVIVPKDLLES